MTVGERIKQRRIELGLSQEELAQKMGYSGKSTICKAETWGTKDVKISKVEKFAEYLDTSVHWLLGWETDPTHAKHITIDENSVTTYTVDLSEDEYKLIVKLRESKKADLIEQVFTYTEALLTMEKFSPLSSKRGTEADK